MDFEAKRQARQAALRECNEACNEGDVEKIKGLLGSHGLLEPDDALDRLIWMVEEDDLPVSRCLLELGIIDLHKTAIRLLAEVKSRSMLELLAEFGFDFRQHGHNILHKFTTPLSTLKYLLDLGADPTKPVDSSLIPFLKRGERDDTIQCLNDAAAQCDIPAFELLVSRGADPRQSIALHRATRFKRTDDGERTVTAMINYLVDVHGMDPNADDECGGLRKLMTSFREQGAPLEYVLANENREAALALVRKGADPEMVCNKSKIDEVRRLIDT